MMPDSREELLFCDWTSADLDRFWQQSGACRSKRLLEFARKGITPLLQHLLVALAPKGLRSAEGSSWIVRIAVGCRFVSTATMERPCANKACTAGSLIASLRRSWQRHASCVDDKDGDMVITLSCLQRQIHTQLVVLVCEATLDCLDGNLSHSRCSLQNVCQELGSLCRG